MKILFELFISFAKISFFTFGGGYAMLPMLNRELAQKRKWATKEEIIDFFTMGQCTPGVIAVNVASYIGIKAARKERNSNVNITPQKTLSIKKRYSPNSAAGAAAAALGMVFPPIVVIILLSSAIGYFSEIKAVANALWGIRIAVCAMITITAGQIIKKVVLDVPTLLIAVFSFGALIAGISPIIIILSAVAAGIVIKAFIINGK